MLAGGKELSDSRCIWKVALPGFTDGLDDSRTTWGGPWQGKLLGVSIGVLVFYIRHVR